MKRLFLFITILISVSVPAQDKNQKQKLLIGFNFSADYSFRTLNNNNGGASTDFVIQNRNDMEQAKFGYTAGLNVYLISSQLVGFETGIQFSDKGYQTKNQDLIYLSPNNNLRQKQKLFMLINISAFL